MTTEAQRVILPPDPLTFRTVFFYVGQGDCTLHLIPDGKNGFVYVLVDVNRSDKIRGVDVVRVLEDLLPKAEGGRPTLDVFVNTHPHGDHLGGIDELVKRIKVRAVWHTGFEPSDQHEAAFRGLKDLVAAVDRGGGAVLEYSGTRETATIGTVSYNILSPAPHVKEEIDELKGEERDSRIHDHCGVVRFSYGTPPRQVMMTGDADKSAWKEHILGPDEYHGARMATRVLSAPHHGSRSFFKLNEDDKEPYTRHLQLMNPAWVVISSPSSSESPHGHPHEDALKLYADQVRRENIRVLGERPECIIYDVFPDGGDALDSDDGALIDSYPSDGSDGGGSKGSKSAGPYVITRLDKGRSMGPRPSDDCDSQRDDA